MGGATDLCHPQTHGVPVLTCGRSDRSLRISLIEVGYSFFLPVLSWITEFVTLSLQSRFHLQDTINHLIFFSDKVNDWCTHYYDRTDSKEESD